MSKLTQSIRIKLIAYAEKRDLTKQEALNEVLDRALAVHRGEIGLKTAYLQLEYFRKDIEVQEFLRNRTNLKCLEA